MGSVLVIWMGGVEDRNDSWEKDSIKHNLKFRDLF